MSERRQINCDQDLRKMNYAIKHVGLMLQPILLNGPTHRDYSRQSKRPPAADVSSRTFAPHGAKSILFPSQEDSDMKSPVVKRSIVIGGHKTSVSLEEAFWNGVKEISGARGKTLSELVSEIDGSRQQGNLSSAIRLFVLDHFRTGASSPIC
jgi:predicted DNA-binding ribbon-helix-helix protein